MNQPKEPLTADFGRIADRYDSYRPADENWRELFKFALSVGGGGALRVLDAGCGTGRLAEAIAARGADVHGIDVSPRMVAKARERIGDRVTVADVSDLPFADHEFDRVYMWRVVHLLDRGDALPEIRRVLRIAGRLVIVTQDPSCFSGYWLNKFFPSLLAIDLTRFPTPSDLSAELRQVGFSSVRVERLEQRVEIDRQPALDRATGRFISTLHLISHEEFEQGIARMRTELPERVIYDDTWAVVVAER